MAREIRITIDDDEVFERMKRRKRALDLSWEEVLYRGLGERPDDDVGDRLGRQIESHVADTIRASLGIDPERTPGWAAGSNWSPDSAESPTAPGGSSPPGSGEFESDSDLEGEMARLADAEDAVLSFDALDGERYTVPLRVNLATSTDGLDVEVVAVRSGKSVRDRNRFDGDARKRVVTALAAGETGTLALGDGAESYAVRPALTWGRRDDGTPTVTAVEIADVVLDAD